MHLSESFIRKINTQRAKILTSLTMAIAKLVSYETTPGSYGQIRFNPLVLANVTNTLLEDWFINYKFLDYATNKVEPSLFEKHRLNPEFEYPLRLHTRTFSEIQAATRDLIERSMFQEIFRILVTTLEEANHLHQAAIQEKVGGSVFALREAIDKSVRKYNRLGFSDKLKRFEVNERFTPFIDSLGAINKARNCLEHRNGLVGKQDCNEDGKLIIRICYPALITDDGPLRAFTSPTTPEKQPKLDFVTEAIRFSKNERVSLSFPDCYKLLYTLNFGLKGVIDSIYELCNVEDQGVILRQF